MSMFPPELEGRRIDVSTAQTSPPTEEQRRASARRAARTHLFIATTAIAAAPMPFVDANALQYFGALFTGALIGLRWGGSFSAVREVYYLYALPLSLCMLLFFGLTKWFF